MAGAPTLIAALIAALLAMPHARATGPDLQMNGEAVEIHSDVRLRTEDGRILSLDSVLATMDRVEAELTAARAELAVRFISCMISLVLVQLGRLTDRSKKIAPTRCISA